MIKRIINFEAGGPGDGGGGDGGTKLVFETPEAAAAALEKEHGYIIRNKDQETEFLTNHTKNVVGDKTRELYSTFENEIHRITGLEKQSDEKAYAFLERAISSINGSAQTNAEKVAELTAQVDQLKKDGGSAEQIDQLNKELKSVKEMHRNEKTKWEQQIADINAAQFKSQVDNLVSDSISRSRPSFNKDLGQEVVEGFVQSAQLQFDSKYEGKLLNGAIVWHDRATGDPVMDTKTANPASTDTLMEPFLKPVVKEQIIQPGAGGDGGGEPGGGGATEHVLSDKPENIKTKGQLFEWMRTTKEMDHKSKDFMQKYNATIAHYKLTGI